MAEQVKDIRDYLAIFKKRKRYFIIPFVALFIMVSRYRNFVALHL